MKEVLVSVEHGVAVVTLDAPERRNAITVEMASELVSVFEDIDARSDVGAVVIRGAEGFFCAGADLARLRSVMDDPAEGEAYAGIDQIYQTFLRFGALNVPTIAAVRGAAVGAGLNLALAADLRIAARNARFISGFSRLGLHPGGGHFQLVARAANPETAIALGLFGEEVDGERAASLGLVWESVEDADVEARAIELAAHAGRDPLLARRAVASLRGTTASTVPWPVAVQAERSPQLWSLRRAKKSSGPR